jgi:murein DD-endopeptidase MepM/ murein hydrolase activator NlpD
MPGEDFAVFHTGVDIGAKAGTPVFATQGGTVVFAYIDLEGTGGKLVVVETAGRYARQITRYGHLQDILVEKGELVKPGDILGLVGSTGFSTGPHLHFEMYSILPDGSIAWHDPMNVICDYKKDLQVPHFNSFGPVN